MLFAFACFVLALLHQALQLSIQTSDSNKRCFNVTLCFLFFFFFFFFRCGDSESVEICPAEGSPRWTLLCSAGFSCAWVGCAVIGRDNQALHYPVQRFERAKQRQKFAYPCCLLLWLFVEVEWRDLISLDAECWTFMGRPPPWGTNVCERSTWWACSLSGESSLSLELLELSPSPKIVLKTAFSGRLSGWSSNRSSCSCGFSALLPLLAELSERSGSVWPAAA